MKTVRQLYKKATNAQITSSLQKKKENTWYLSQSRSKDQGCVDSKL